MKSTGKYRAVLRIKEVIDRSGKSVADIAAETGMSHHTVLQYYRGSTDGITLPALGSIAKALGVPPGELFEKEVIENH